MDQPEGGFVARHTSMPPRIQKTPYGDVTLTSRWQRDRYYLMAYGEETAVRWLFPKVDRLELIGEKVRHTFDPAPTAITVERDLRRACSAWQDVWLDWLNDHAEGAHPATKKPDPLISTFGQLLDHLGAERELRLAVTTRERDRYFRKQWLLVIPSKTSLVSITEPILVAARDKIAQSISPATANTAFGMLKTYLTWAFNQGLVRTQFFRSIKPLREASVKSRSRAWWTANEVETALEFAAKDPHQTAATLIVGLGALLGMRPEEIIMQQWQNLDLDAVDPKSGQPKPVCRIVPNGDWQPKDGEPRDIPIPDRLLSILRQHRKAAGYLLNAEHERRIQRKPGAPWSYRYDPRRLWARLMKAMKAAGHRTITLYGLRHTFASNLLIAGVSDVKVSRWLGHSDTRMLHRHYGHLLSYDDQINAVRYTSSPPPS